MTQETDQNQDQHQSPIADLIDDIMSDKLSNANDKFENMVGARVNDKLDQMKVATAASVFASDEVSDDAE